LGYPTISINGPPCIRQRPFGIAGDWHRLPGAAGSACCVSCVTRVAIGWRYRGCGSARPAIAGWRSVNAGCAGPDWRYVAGHDNGERRSTDNRPVIAAADLKVELEALAVQAKYDAAAGKRVRVRLQQLEAAYAYKWGAAGDVAEAFGSVYTEIKDLENAIRWCARVVTAQDGTASQRATEQLANLRARRAKSRSEVQSAIRELQRLGRSNKTSERASLLGSAFKRLAIIEQKSRRITP
jgi:hypothetical protein